MATAMGTVAWLPFAVALETGLRIGDVAALKWADIDDDGHISFVAHKTGKAGETFVSPAVMAALRAHRRAGAAYVFEGREWGKPITRQALWARMKAAAQAAAIDAAGVSPHSLRKVYAVDVTQERGIRAAQEALQHTHIEDTEIYALSDWITGENAEKPLKRGDIVRIVDEIIKIVGLDSGGGSVV